MWRALMALALVATACAGDRVKGQVGDNNDDDEDLDGPAIHHDPVDEPQTYGVEIYIEAEVEDESGVFVVELLYQQETAGEWTSKPMNGVGGALYQGRIDGDDVASSGMRYFIQATDTNDNTSCLPEDCEEDSWHFSVIP